MDSIMKKDNVDSRLKKIFEEKFKIDFDSKDEKMLDENLLGSNLCLSPTDLLYLLHDIEDEFIISIPQIDIAEGKFSSFSNIKGIIQNQIK